MKQWSTTLGLFNVFLKTPIVSLEDSRDNHYVEYNTNHSFIPIKVMEETDDL